MHSNLFKNSTQIIKDLIITEKSDYLLAENQYSFNVDIRAKKQDIKKTIETLFSVKIVSINTHCLPQKQRNFLVRSKNKNAKYKRAIVKLAPNNKMDLFF
uniref:Ribosomal protein L23 n=1 Tax=Cyanoptyche gloeocystis TaxID=77922 RepID=A0A3G1IWJ0_9EUKA|nr:ribosomal protein L23 [Cyanoptyche gloeocystis]|mmetsp:Transcript_13664/g.23427  ORF Transcript_13664/g.23427 Transcript_13664/m.23427 type:complete len:100 (+) Transcript_13664:717-1016(+)